MNDDYYKTAAYVDEYIELAKDVNGAQLIEKLKEQLPKGSSVLELGSGPGSDWKILSNIYQVVGSDNSKEFLKRLIAKYPDGDFIEIDARSLKSNRHFDGIYSNKVLHHLSDEELFDSAQSQAAILNPKGIVCHSFWKGNGSEIFKGLFVNYHQESSLAAIFKDHFEIIMIEPYQEFEAEDSLLFIGRKI